MMYTGCYYRYIIIKYNTYKILFLITQHYSSVARLWPPTVQLLSIGKCFPRQSYVPAFGHVLEAS